MAKFRLQEGEQLIERAHAKESGGEWNDQGELILTDRRIVLTRTRSSPLAMLGLLGLLGVLLSPGETRVEYEIKRDRLASAEATAPKELSVRSTGEGYALTRFDVRIEHATAWAERLQRWRTGEATEIATATVVVKS